MSAGLTSSPLHPLPSSVAAKMGDRVLTPNQTADYERWQKEWADRGTALLKARYEHADRRYRDALAEVTNAGVLAEKITAAVRAGAVKPRQALRDLQSLSAAIDTAEGVVSEVRDGIAASADLDPVAVAEEFASRMPAMPRPEPPNLS